jgi:hypothetical protein
VDIRLPVGAIFAIYGVMLVVWGFTSGDLEPRHMINGINVNIWSGIGMFVFGAVMLVLARRSPTGPRSTSEQPAGPRPGQH